MTVSHSTNYITRGGTTVPRSRQTRQARGPQFDAQTMARQLNQNSAFTSFYPGGFDPLGKEYQPATGPRHSQRPRTQHMTGSHRTQFAQNQSLETPQV